MAILQQQLFTLYLLLNIEGNTFTPSSTGESYRMLLYQDFFTTLILAGASQSEGEKSFKDEYIFLSDMVMVCGMSSVNWKVMKHNLVHQT